MLKNPSGVAWQTADPAVGRLRQYPWLFKTCYGIDRQIVHSVPYISVPYISRCTSLYFMCIYVVCYIKEMSLPILLIFYVFKWKNGVKHWEIGIWRHCDVIIGRGKSKLSVGLLCTEMIIVCKFHDPSIIGSRDTEGGPRSAPPQSQIDQKSPVWIGLIQFHTTLYKSNHCSS